MFGRVKHIYRSFILSCVPEDSRWAKSIEVGVLTLRFLEISIYILYRYLLCLGWKCRSEFVFSYLPTLLHRASNKQVTRSAFRPALRVLKRGGSRVHNQPGIFWDDF